MLPAVGKSCKRCSSADFARRMDGSDDGGQKRGTGQYRCSTLMARHALAADHSTSTEIDALLVSSQI